MGKWWKSTCCFGGALSNVLLNSWDYVDGFVTFRDYKTDVHQFSLYDIYVVFHKAFVSIVSMDRVA